ncbi:MAG: hypothetical protein KC503_36190 [Myxococcales bacterium]|nr:hypothetical protein [Myxococcales bacterium]
MTRTTVSTVVAALLCVALGSGCDDSTPSADTRSDAGPDAPSCAFSTAPPQQVSGAAGGRLLIEVAARGNDSITLEGAPSSWSMRREDGRLVVRLPYDAAGEHALALLLDCADGGRARAPIAVTVRALAWRTLPSWQPGSSGPSAREHAPLHVDGDRMLAIGGFLYQPAQGTVADDLWQLDLSSERWQKLDAGGAHVAIAGVRVAPDGSGALLVHGGQQSGGAYSTDLWRLDLAVEPPSWSKVSAASGAPGGVTLHAFIHDTPRARYVAMGGISGNALSGGAIIFETAGGGAWKPLEIAAGPSPSPRYGFFFAHDAEGQRLIVWSGAQQPSAADPINAAQDLWSLDLAASPARWQKLAAAGDVPPGRRNGCWAFDSEGRRLIVWGGTSDGRTTQPGLFVLSLDVDDVAQPRWQRVDLAGEPPIRSSCSGTYDATRKRALFGFGNSATATYADLHELAL